MTRHQPLGQMDDEGPRASPLWLSTATAGPRVASLNQALVTDVLVIGGGIAGLSTALHLAEAGVDVCVIEARSIGGGATGQSGGLVAPDFIRHTPDSIGTALGRPAGERLTRMIGGSATQLFDLIRRVGIECDAQQDGFYTPAHTEALAAQQRSYAAQWASRGFPVRFVEGGEARALLGVDRYCGALRFDSGGSLNPLGFARGLATAAQRQGARLWADSPVVALTRAGGRWIARTPQGSVSARRLVLAANGGNAALHPALARTVLPLHVIQFATAPVTPDQRRSVLPEGGAFTDKAPYLFTGRLDGHGHLISAFPMHYLVRGEQAWFREARRRIVQHFAALPDPEIRFLWEGVAWVNSSLLPELYDLGEDAVAIQACNGRGISVNTAIGIEMADALVHRDMDRLSLRPRPPVPIRMHTGASLLPKLLMSMAYLSN
jgi:glycine/D-amino acid oxidase-like deaminating enzyme